MSEINAWIEHFLVSCPFKWKTSMKKKLMAMIMFVSITCMKKKFIIFFWFEWITCMKEHFIFSHPNLVIYMQKKIFRAIIMFKWITCMKRVSYTLLLFWVNYMHEKNIFYFIFGFSEEYAYIEHFIVFFPFKWNTCMKRN